MQPDESLIVQAQMKSTGASVHYLANVISAYKLCCQLDEPRFKKKTEKLEQKLRKFIYTGELNLNES